MRADPSQVAYRAGAMVGATALASGTILLLTSHALPVGGPRHGPGQAA
jgi:hypothetical protein